MVCDDENGTLIVDGRGLYDQLGDAKQTAKNIASAIRLRGQE